jgi:phosphoribosylaminoimidazole-succinocarboxamide synthase
MEKREDEYKGIIKANLENVLGSGYIPELGNHKKGKVRDVHFFQDKLIAVASDRVSCFDSVLSRCIPYKGAVLNLFNQWAMENSVDIIQNAMLPSPDANVIIQKKMTNIGFECVVRGYVWGSLASDYEKGLKEKCGVKLPDGLLRYQKLGNPIFTPTSKAEKGHDEDVTLETIAKEYGGETAEKIKKASIDLFNRGAELADKAGMIFIDTKYEFGRDDKENLFLIDESNTPDSSRYCSKEEYGLKWIEINRAMENAGGIAGFRYEGQPTVNELLKAKPELKIKEASKQFVRDVLIEGGYKEGQKIPDLTDEQVIETSFRYIDSYEKLTGKKFDFNIGENPKKRIMNNLKKAGLAYGGCVVPIGASDKDKDKAHWEKIEEALMGKVPYTEPVYLSAHKQTQEVLDYVKKMDSTSIEPLVYITFAGRSNGLGPVVAGNSKYPVITCPVFSDKTDYMVNIHSSLQMPGKLPLATIIEPGNAALYAKRIIDLAR